MKLRSAHAKSAASYPTSARVAAKKVERFIPYDVYMVYIYNRFIKGSDWHNVAQVSKSQVEHSFISNITYSILSLDRSGEKSSIDLRNSFNVKLALIVQSNVNKIFHAFVMKSVKLVDTHQERWTLSVTKLLLPLSFSNLRNLGTKRDAKKEHERNLIDICSIDLIECFF